jgi:hypothetical protein
MRSVWIASFLIAGFGISAGSIPANAGEPPKAETSTPPSQAEQTDKSDKSSSKPSSSSSTSTTRTGQSSKSTPSGKTYEIGGTTPSGKSYDTSRTDQSFTTTIPSGRTYESTQPDRYTDEGNYTSTRRHDERRSYRVVHPLIEYRPRPVHRHVEHYVVVHHVERRRYHPAPRYVAVRRPLAPPVYYYGGKLVGRDPDPNVRLMLLRDNGRTLWAR